MLLLVTVLGLFAWWVKINANQVRERKTVLNFRPAVVHTYWSESASESLPVLWRWWGVIPLQRIQLERKLIGDEDVARIRKLYPEAIVEIVDVPFPAPQL